jgi:hypothetical protein
MILSKKYSNLVLVPQSQWLEQQRLVQLSFNGITASLAAQPGANVDVAAETIRSVGGQLFAQWFGPPQFLMGPAGPVPSPRPDVWYGLVGYDASNQPKLISMGSSPPFNFAPNLSTTGFSCLGVVPLAV